MCAHMWSSEVSIWIDKADGSFGRGGQYVALPGMKGAKMEAQDEPEDGGKEDIGKAGLCGLL